MDINTPSDSASKKVQLEDLSKEEVIIKYRGLLAIAQKAKQAKDALISENNKLKEQVAERRLSPTSDSVIESLTQQKLELLTAFEELKTQKKFLDSKFINSEKQLNLAELKISELDTLNESYKRQVNRLTDENEQLITHLDKLEKQIEELKKIGLQQQEQLLSLERSNALLTQTNNDINRELKTQNVDQKTENEVIELQRMLTVSLEELKKLQVENGSLSVKSDDMQNLLVESDKNLKILGNELIEKNKAIEILKTNLEELQVKFINGDYEKLSVENDNLRITIQLMQNSLSESENFLAVYKQEIAEKNKELDKNINIADDLTTELHKNRALVEKLKQDIINTNNKLSDNQIVSSGVASDLENANGKLKEKLKSYHSKMIRFAGDVKYLKQSKNELISAFKIYIEQVSGWKLQLNVLLQIIKRTEDDKQAMELEHNIFKVKIISTEEENKTLKQCMDTFKRNSKDEVKNLLDKIFKLENEIEKQREKFICISYKLNEEIKQMEFKQKRVLELEEKIEQLTYDCVQNVKREELYMNRIKEFDMISNNREEQQNTLQRELYQCKEEYRKVLEENTILCEELHCLQEDHKILSLSKIDAINENETLKTQLENLQKENEHLQDRVRECGKTMDNHVSEVAELNKLIKQLYNNIDKSKFTETQLAEKSGEEILKLVRESTNLKQIIKELEIKLQEMVRNKTKMVETGVQVTDTESPFDTYEEKVNTLKRENTELLSEMNEMNQALKERGETISKQQAYCEDTLKKLHMYEAQANKSNDIINKKDELIRELQQKLQSLRTASVCSTSEMISENILKLKDNEIKSLKNEIEELKDKLSNIGNQYDVTTPQDITFAESEIMSTSTISRMEDVNRMKDLESSWEERYGKLRTLAIKLKGKIRNLTEELSKEQSEKVELQKNIAKTTHTYQQQIDKLQDDFEASKKESNTYLKKLDVIALDISKDKQKLASNEELILKLKTEIDGLNQDKLNTENWKKQVSSKVQSLKKELEANALLKKEFENKINKLNGDLEAKDKALRNEIDKHNQTKNTLQESTNECKKQSVLNLEMQDYERTAKEMSQKLDKKQDLIAKLKTQIDSQKANINTVKEQNTVLEDNIKTLEKNLDVARSGNVIYAKKLSDLENIVFDKEQKVQDLTHSLENRRLENEELSTQLSKIMAESQKSNNCLKEEKDHLKGENLGLEQRLREVRDALKLKEDELKELYNDYSNYKVRAKSVLRQNQSRDIGTEEKLTEEAGSLKAQIEVLTKEVIHLRFIADQTKSENKALTLKIGTLQKQIADSENEIEENKKQYEQLSLKHQNTITEHADTVRGLKVHADTLAQCYRQQLSDQETRHNIEIIELQSKLDKGTIPLDVPSLLPPSMPREEGEGSESIDSSNNNSMQPISLEKLLSNESDQEIGFIKKQLTESEAKISYLTALLADTEQDLAKHVQMNKLLKEEIRRQQRSVEREEHAKNLEYLKNVVFKFVTLASGDERSRLVPVLNTILKLSPEETHKLNVVARSDKSWGTYLPLNWGTSNKPQ